jgi:hypothetical protein
MDERTKKSLRELALRSQLPIKRAEGIERKNTAVDSPKDCLHSPADTQSHSQMTRLNPVESHFFQPPLADGV